MSLTSIISDIFSGNTVPNPANAPVAQPAPVETKVTASAIGTALGGVVVGIVNSTGLPKIIKTVVTLAVPVLVTAVFGYLAPHTERKLPLSERVAEKRK
jgi:hypothetical protein